MKKLLFVTGSYPPEVCGVGDYSQKLYNALREKSNMLELFYKADWRIRNAYSYLREIKSKNADLIHIQYPTEGYGYSFLPLLLAFFLPKRKIIITLHELSNRTFKAKLFTLSLILFSRTIIVTNDAERRYLNKFPVLRRKNIHIINIGSNIPKSRDSERETFERKVDLAYFGHIRPIKGLESFIKVANELNNKNCVVFGQSMPKYKGYLEDLKAKSNQIRYVLNASVLQTADNLSECKVVYLPFPDGVSSRRGSLMAAALNGCLIVSTYSQDIAENLFFEKYCYLVRDESQAKQIIERLLADKGSTDKDVSKLMDFFSWEEIAKKHLEVYNNIN